MTAARAITGIGSWFQLASPNEPSSQNSTDWVAWGLPRKMRKLVTDSNIADRTTPHRISWVGASCRPFRDTRNTAAMAASAPRTLPTEIAHIPSDANAPRSRTAVAPTLAPDDTPSRNGSASALRTSTWTTDPAVVRAAPTTAASSTRGSRICQTMMPATVLSGWPDNWLAMTCQTAAGLSGTDPMPTPAVIVISSSTAQAPSTSGSGVRSRRRPASRAGVGRPGGDGVAAPGGASAAEVLARSSMAHRHPPTAHGGRATRPSSEGHFAGPDQATGLAPEGDHRCGTAPGSHRTSLAGQAPAAAGASQL